MKKFFRYFKNEEIRSEKLFVIDEKGKRLGEISKMDAIKKAKEEDKDLVLISAHLNPPIAKIIEYGKFLYQQSKKKKKQKQKELKEIKISFNISEHDLETKKNRFKKFLSKGHQVRLTMVLHGRENMFKDEAVNKLKKFAETLEAKVETPLKVQGNTLFIQFSP